MFTAHFSRFYASHCFLKSSDFFRLSLCCSLNRFLSSNFDCLSFYYEVAALIRAVL